MPGRFLKCPATLAFLPSTGISSSVSVFRNGVRQTIAAPRETYACCHIQG